MKFSDKFPAPTSIPPLDQARHSHTIIFLHGRSSTGEEMAVQLFDEDSSGGLSLRQHFPQFKWVFPTSKSRSNPVFQEEMHEWFSVASLTNPALRDDEQVPELSESIQYINQLIRQEAEIVPADRLFLGGVSMGCATALMAWLCVDAKLAGFLGLFGWMPFERYVGERANVVEGEELGPAAAVGIKTLQEKLGLPRPPKVAKATSHAVQTPAFLGHSQNDDVVDVILGRSIRNSLKSMGTTVTYCEYAEGGHWFKEPEGVDDMIEFLRESLD